MAGIWLGLVLAAAAADSSTGDSRKVFADLPLDGTVASAPPITNNTSSKKAVFADLPLEGTVAPAPPVTNNTSSKKAVFADLPLEGAVAPVPLATNISPTAQVGMSARINSVPNATSWAPGRDMDSLDDKQRLAVGDRVTFRVLEDQEEPKSLIVTDAGELNVPELGLVMAAGKVCRELAFEVKAKLEQTTYYHATVIIGIDLLNKTMSGRRVYVAGQVHQPGPQEIPAGETWTVSKAIMRAGGFTDYGDKKRVRLVRAGSKGAAGKTFTVNVANIWEKGRTDVDLAVEPEDLIYVPARAVNFY
jgi:polysaccharide export outer membrane protein